MIERIKIVFGSGFGAGFIPFAPGTFGSFAALLPVYLLLRSDFVFLMPFLILLAALTTFWVAGVFEQKWQTDAPMLVSDEWAGQFLTFSGIVFTGVASTDIIILLTGFALFRLFDIWKPLGINQLQQLNGAWGILADDLLAGLYALICLKTLIFIWPQYFGFA